MRARSAEGGAHLDGGFLNDEEPLFDADLVESDEALEKGDLPGHEFRGNQWTGGGGSWPNVATSDAWKTPRKEFVGPYPAVGDYNSPEAVAWRQKEADWDRSMVMALTQGDITQEDARTLGFFNSEGYPWQPLPDTLYHVTSAGDAVQVEGLKTRDESGNTSGIGGGTSDTISLTSDRAMADQYLNGMLLAHDVMTGKITPEDLVQQAKDGTDAKGPSYSNLLDTYSRESARSIDGLPSQLYDTLNGTRSWFVGEDTPPESVALRLSFQGVNAKDLGDAHLVGGFMQRASTSEERVHQKAELINRSLFWRDVAGGPANPAFFTNDWNKFAATPRSDIKLLEFETKPGSQGKYVAGESEYRVASGSVLRLKSVLKSVQKGDVPGHAFHGNQYTDGGADGPGSQPAQVKGVFFDNPRGSWEEGEKAKAEASKMKVSGAVTAGFTGRLPVDELKGLPGENNEHLIPNITHDDKGAPLRDSVKEHGITSPISIQVNHRGEAYVAEGNHRLALAAEFGHKTVPVRVWYRAGSENVPGHFNLETMRARFGKVRKGDVAGHEFHGNQWTGGGGIKSFMDELHAQTSTNPLNERERVAPGSNAAIEVYAHGTSAHISDIRSFKPGDKTGAGSKALGLLTDLADKHGVTLTLIPKHYGERGPSSSSLADWYRRAGFIGSGEGWDVMTRAPKTVLHLGGTMREIPIGKLAKAVLNRPGPGVTPLEAMTEAHVAALRVKIHEALDAIGRDISDAGVTSYLSLITTATTDADIVDGVLDAVTDANWLAVSDAVDADMVRQFKVGAQLEAVDAGRVAVDIATDWADVHAIAYADARSAEMVGMKWVDGELVVNPNPEWSIQSSTRDMLRSTIEQAVTDGDSAKMLADSILENTAFSEERADMIARTELNLAHIGGRVHTAEELGAVGKYTLLGSEHDTEVPESDECDDAHDAGVIGWDEEFVDGYNFPVFHPNCVISGTRVAAAGVRGAYRRFYEGEVITIRVANHPDLTVTPHHPVLTQRGFVAAKDIKRGDYIFKTNDPTALVRALEVEDYEVEARCENLFDALALRGTLTNARTEVLDFHGDGVVDGEVDIVRTEGPVVADVAADGDQHGIDPGFRRGHWPPAPLDADGSAVAVAGGEAGAADAPSGALGRDSPLLGGLAPLGGEPVLVGASHKQTQPGKSVSEGTAAAAEIIREIHSRLPAAVALVQVKDVIAGKRYSGHVFNLETVSGWFLADSIVVHNCKCDFVTVYPGDPEAADLEDDTVH